MKMPLVPIMYTLIFSHEQCGLDTLTDHFHLFPMNTYHKQIIPLFAAFFSFFANGQTDRYVATTGTDSGDCTNSGSPCATIQYAHDQSSTSSSITDVIHIADGAYSETNVTINRNIHLSGPNLPATATFTNGSGPGNRFAYINGISPSPDVIVSDLSFSDYDATGLTADNGGVFRLGTSIGSLTVNDCQFSNNVADGGGVIYAYNGALIINDSDFSGNSTVTRAGGAIWVPSNNTTNTITISNSTFISNQTQQDAGGIDDGGAIHFRGFQLTISNSFFYGNMSGDNGGAINAHGANANSRIDMTNCVLYENEAEDLGGGIYLNNISSNIYHCTIANNDAETTATTIASNTAGGGIEYKENDGGYEATIHIANTILWNNRALNGTGAGDRDIREGSSNTSTLITVENCLYKVGSIAGLTTAQNNLTGVTNDPLFQDDANGDLSLRKYNLTWNNPGDLSPAVNAGIDVSVAADILGRSRNGAEDIGAYEFQEAPLPVELSEFIVRYVESEQQVYSAWTTLSEVNNDFFTLERSSDGITFNSIKNIAGYGNSNRSINYQTWDHNPLSGRSYYRLKQTDFDGETSFSDIQSVDIRLGSQLQIFPIPASNYFNISMTGDPNKVVRISILSLSGSILFSFERTLSGGRSIFNVPIPQGTKPGIYVVLIDSSSTGNVEILGKQRIAIR